MLLTLFSHCSLSQELQMLILPSEMQKRARADEPEHWAMQCGTAVSHKICCIYLPGFEMHIYAVRTQPKSLGRVGAAAIWSWCCFITMLPFKAEQLGSHWLPSIYVGYMVTCCSPRKLCSAVVQGEKNIYIYCVIFFNVFFPFSPSSKKDLSLAQLHSAGILGWFSGWAMGPLHMSICILGHCSTLESKCQLWEPSAFNCRLPESAVLLPICFPFSP